ncbi:hypothetical protein [Streptomyces spiramyceticus]|uniref:hypothetical protein n=1 Tax=Streptomyces spiramyceticus TaxID=299717 RepID=UPI00237B41F0|nr:hypothetical protein [Streptomyces spiramyceticus]
MRLLQRLAAVVGAVLTTTVLCASQAVAGGPTSVLVVSPESGRTSSLYYTASPYRELEKNLGPLRSGGVAERPSELAPETLEEGGAWRQVTVTWLSHDVSVWRVNHVFLPKSDGPIWVSTVTEDPSADGERWHEAEDPAQLRALLKKLGVLDGPSAARVSGSGSQESEEAAAPPEAASTGPGDSTGWWWSIPGLAAGVLIGFGGTVLVRRGDAARRGTDPPGPRRQLIDM